MVYIGTMKTKDRAIARATWQLARAQRKRRHRVLALRLEGWSFTEIGEEMGVTRQRAWFMYKTARKEP
jgi:DNA-directed RNA polymerase specialized sigma24 family protein